MNLALLQDHRHPLARRARGAMRVPACCSPTRACCGRWTKVYEHAVQREAALPESIVGAACAMPTPTGVTASPSAAVAAFDAEEGGVISRRRRRLRHLLQGCAPCAPA